MNNYHTIGMGTYKLQDKKCTDIIKNGLELGYRLIDTAQLYKNHDPIKNGLALSNVSRDDIFLTSKIHNKNIIKKDIGKAICDIKSELNVDYMNMILLHNPVKNYVEGWKELIYCKNHFDVLNIGVSNFDIEHLDNIKNSCGFYPSFNQIEFNVFNQRTELVNFMNENNIIIQSHSGLYRGLALNNNNDLNNISIECNISVPNIMHTFILQNNIGIIPMTTNYEHLYNNLNKLDNLPINILNKIYNLNNDTSLFKKY